MISFRTFAAPLVTFTFVALGVACSSGSDGGGTQPAPVAADKASFITQVCQSFAPCCTKAGKTPAQDQCESLYTTFLGPLTYDPAKGSACLADIQKLKDTAAFCSGEGPQSTACEQVFQTPGGSKKPGETCTKTEECALSTEGEVECASLWKSDGTTIRKCQVQVAGKVGDTPCGGTKDGSTTSFTTPDGATDLPSKAFICSFKDGAYCDQKTGACKAVGKAGDACDGFDSYQCGKDAYCNFSSSKCEPKVAVGADCSSSSDACVATAYCDSTSKKCAAKKADGAACESFDECLSDDCTDKKCGSTNSALDFFCK